MPRRPRTPVPALSFDRLEDRSLPAGTLDPTFGGTGIVTTGFGVEDDFGQSVATDALGRVVVAGSTVAGGRLDVALARYLDSGALDPSFGTGGKVVTSLGAAGSAQRVSLAIDAAGRVVVAATVLGPGGSDFALARYDVAGALDTSFGAGVVVVTDLGTAWDTAAGLVIDHHDRIVVAGYVGTGADFDFAVARYTPCGALDPTFSADGRVTSSFSAGEDEAFAVAVDALDRVVAVGRTGVAPLAFDWAVARYTEAGALDPTFDGDGVAVTPVGLEPYGVAVDAAGRVVVAGETDWDSRDFGLARYNPDGSPDTTFDGDGFVRVDFGAADGARDLVIDAAGRLVAAGFFNTGGGRADLALVRYNPDGSPDATFGTGGRVVTAAGTGEDVAVSIALDAAGRVVVAGYSYAVGDSHGTSDFVVARYDGGPPPVLAVGVDVKPGSAANTINIRAKGVLQVALLSGPGFDARGVDLLSLRLGDPDRTGRVAPTRTTLEDVDGDGDLDLVLHFRIPDLVAAGAVGSGSTSLELTGLLFDGTAFVGTDGVRIVP